MWSAFCLLRSSQVAMPGSIAGGNAGGVNSVLFATQIQPSSLLLGELGRRGGAGCRPFFPLVRSDLATTAAKNSAASAAMELVSGAVNALFSYEPFFQFAAGRARQMIIQRGAEIGHPWPPELAALKLHDWDAELQACENRDLDYPEYYLKPFHAYEKGNLSWDAALEVELAAKSVHANVFDPEKKKLDPLGDIKLRNSYHKKMLEMLRTTPKSIVDIGCATGLSTFGLHQTFPDADVVIGADLSPYFISVANYWLQRKSAITAKPSPIQYVHALGEDTGLQSGSFDLVSMCLICHELPRSATKQIFAEANRLLKVGGALAIMEMNPYSPRLKAMVNNVFAFTAFKATEPYFDDYRTFGIEDAIEDSGFAYPTQAETTPRHRILVAYKRELERGPTSILYLP